MPSKPRDRTDAARSRSAIERELSALAAEVTGSRVGTTTTRASGRSGAAAAPESTTSVNACGDRARSSARVSSRVKRPYPRGLTQVLASIAMRKAVLLHRGRRRVRRPNRLARRRHCAKQLERLERDAGPQEDFIRAVAVAGSDRRSQKPGGGRKPDVSKRMLPKIAERRVRFAHADVTIRVDNAAQ